MHNPKVVSRPDDNSGPHPARGKDHPTGIDDIGLPSGIQPDGESRLDRIKPDPDYVQKKPHQSGD